MIETVVLEVLTKVTNIERTQQNVVVGERSLAKMGQTRRFEQNGVVVELTPQSVLQDKLFFAYKVLLHSKNQSWVSVSQGTFQADLEGTTQLLVSDKRFGNFIDLSVKTFSDTPAQIPNLQKNSPHKLHFVPGGAMPDKGSETALRERRKEA